MVENKNRPIPFFFVSVIDIFWYSLITFFKSLIDLGTTKTKHNSRNKIWQITNMSIYRKTKALKSIPEKHGVISLFMLPVLNICITMVCSSILRNSIFLNEFLLIDAMVSVIFTLLRKLCIPPKHVSSSWNHNYQQKYLKQSRGYLMTVFCSSCKIVIIEEDIWKINRP